MMKALLVVSGVPDVTVTLFLVRYLHLHANSAMKAMKRTLKIISGMYPKFCVSVPVVMSWDYIRKGVTQGLYICVGFIMSTIQIGNGREEKLTHIDSWL